MTKRLVPLIINWLYWISAIVSARIINQISPETPSREIEFFLRLLLELGGKGPRFAFKALYKGGINFDSMEENIGFVSETGRLAFVDQYLQARSSVRLKYGTAFKDIFCQKSFFSLSRTLR